MTDPAPTARGTSRVQHTVHRKLPSRSQAIGGAPRRPVAHAVRNRIRSEDVSFLRYFNVDVTRPDALP